MTRELSATTPPLYCGKCGARLLVDRVEPPFRGFDIMTGDRVPSSSLVQRRCTVDHNHDAWRLYDDKWIKVQP